MRITTLSGLMAALTQQSWIEAAKAAGEITDGTMVQTCELTYAAQRDGEDCELTVKVSMVPSARFNLGQAIIGLEVDGEKVWALPDAIWSAVRRDLKAKLAEQAKAITLPDQTAERLAEDRLMEAERQRLDSPAPITSAEHPFDESRVADIGLQSVLSGLDPARSVELARTMHPALDALHASTGGDRPVLLSNAEARLLFDLIAGQRD